MSNKYYQKNKKTNKSSKKNHVKYIKTFLKKKNHTQKKKVEHNSKFLFGIY